jgi:hypothetical protein
MSRCWLSLVDAWPDDATAAARVTEDGERAGVLAAWLRRGKPTRNARRIDSRLIDPGGEPASISFVLAPANIRVLFDDTAVQEARRRVLVGPPFDAVSTLLRDSSHFEGAVTVARGDQAARLADEPFARIFPARILEVEAGLFGRVDPPAGPTIERYGSAEPWPWDRFVYAGRECGASSPRSRRRAPGSVPQRLSVQSPPSGQVDRTDARARGREGET